MQNRLGDLYTLMVWALVPGRSSVKGTLKLVKESLMAFTKMLVVKEGTRLRMAYSESSDMACPARASCWELEMLAIVPWEIVALGPLRWRVK